jgi:phosphohistidine phosphatase
VLVTDGAKSGVAVTFGASFGSGLSGKVYVASVTVLGSLDPLIAAVRRRRAGEPLSGPLGVREVVMKKLYLLRHAKSDWADLKLADHDRPLSPRGERAAQTMANYWASRKGGPPQPDLILCSTALRARETLVRVMGAWAAPPPVEYEEGLYLCGEELLLDRLKALPASLGSVLLVAHNPDLQLLARDLCGRQEGRAADLMAELTGKLPTGSFVAIDLAGGLNWSGLRWGCGHLKEFVRPRDITDQLGA